ncbi:3-phosphoshikimate 1-carboxyvinyltransferase [Erythrobacter sp. HL-111]|uniref:3-phosphoshikimate 1-carboxyvinyltransferase n=1 Tax=Erythrobacter sp. HL-111 TaxID=1798193 RepID=UPI0006D9E753|nr:3-phosphoshikimate 1-carboxyvinyltransferase [Erythrobacter sp. HL-111]KPP95056.1 MAG: 3-phosphoshikimate 1-carboxyvinyltransferase AroA [Erythrobacteraceae bacterium HL-111]SDS09486.1 3-phosphoshikimate 1-carboxyvinyltransferase [Erythrobacter sp. HL-111]
MPAHTFHSAAAPLTGRIRVPGDKSISHRALMLAGLAVGRSTIAGLLEGEDVLATAAAMRAMGAAVEREADGTWVVDGAGLGSLIEPAGALDMGNSGTSTRLLMGLVASHGITATFTGDASLSRRPMERVITPLARMGAAITASPGGTLPLMIRGALPAVPIAYRLPVASAQVKSAVLLTGLNTPGITRVIEPVPTRDHTERMLAGFGVKLEIGEEDGATVIGVHGEAELAPLDVTVPGDPSSAAFFMVAATLVPGSDLTIANVGINPTRAGLIEALRMMGADIAEENPREVGGEPVADLRVRHAVLRGAGIDPALAPAMIDEFPALFVAAAMAEGTTTTCGLEELRVKESDRLAAMAAALDLAGARVEERGDGLVIHGTGGEPLAGTPEGARVATRLDHRIAMSMAIAGLASRSGVAIDDTAPIATSFPDFTALLEQAASPAPSSPDLRSETLP